MSFLELSRVEDPGKNELRAFVVAVRQFLTDVVNDDENFGFLWYSDSTLRGLASSTLERDINEGAGLALDQEIGRISDEALYLHGLRGRPLRFKLAVLAAIDESKGTYLNGMSPVSDFAVLSRLPPELRKRFSMREWLKKIIDAIDAILDSLLDAVSAPGAGGILKEFKDALRALA